MYPALAREVASFSQLISNISPSGSTSLTPLSSSGLCDAVIITPILAENKEENNITIVY